MISSGTHGPPPAGGAWRIIDRRVRLDGLERGDDLRPIYVRSTSGLPAPAADGRGAAISSGRARKAASADRRWAALRLV